MTTTTNTYNGWTNRETWLVNLWMSNEEHDSGWCYELANDGRPIYERADELKETLTDAWTNLCEDHSIETSMWTDMMNDALGSVNWREIIEGFEEDAND